MSRAVLKSVDGRVSLPLPLGTTTLGRNNLQLSDKRVSRNQATLQLLRKGDQLVARLVVHGVNACYVKTKDDELYVGKDEEQELSSGDTICFCGQSYPFILSFSPLSVASSSSSSSAQATSGKRKHTGDEEDGEEEGKPIQATKAGPAPKKLRTEPVDSDDEDGGAFSLAFPSFGTGVFQYDIKKAAQVACQHVAAFLEEHDDPRIRIYAVDVAESATLKALRQCWSGVAADPRFEIRVANITQLKTQGLPCRFIANATNEGFSARGSGVNLAINQAAGPALDKETCARYKGSARAGGVYPVPLPPSSPLHSKEGVHYVIHVMAPNMNPQRSNCLHGDYVKGDRLLGQCYSSLLASYWDLASGKTSATAAATATRGEEEEEIEDDIEDFEPTPPSKKPSTGPSTAPAAKKTGGSSANAFSMLMGPKQKAAPGPEAKPAPKPSTGGGAAGAGGGGAWSDALIPFATHPEKVPPNVMHQYDDKTVCFFDKFPKAFKHLLVVPRRLIPNYSSLTADDVPLLKEMLKRGQMTVEQMTARYPTLKFRLGFHAIPSMRQIHMHVISQDFDSEHLKNKKHWNSFTTDFFIEANKFIEMLASEGTIHFDKARYEALLQEPLKCHICKQVQKTIPALKSHLYSHT